MDSGVVLAELELGVGGVVAVAALELVRDLVERPTF
jgi:hypothetical protein